MKTIKTLAMAVVLSACSPVMPVIDGGDASVVNDMPTVSDVGGEDASRDPMLVGTWQWTQPLMPTGAIRTVLDLEANGGGRIQYSAVGRISGQDCDLTRTAVRLFSWQNSRVSSIRVAWGAPCEQRITDTDGGVVTDGGACRVACDTFSMMGERVVDYSFDGMGRLTMRLDNEDIRPYTRVR